MEKYVKSQKRNPTHTFDKLLITKKNGVWSVPVPPRRYNHRDTHAYAKEHPSITVVYSSRAYRSVPWNV